MNIFLAFDSTGRVLHKGLVNFSLVCNGLAARGRQSDDKMCFLNVFNPLTLVTIFTNILRKKEATPNCLEEPYN